MITATCKTKNCQEHGNEINVLGNDQLVECGACGQPTEISNPRPDPAEPEHTIP